MKTIGVILVLNLLGMAAAAQTVIRVAPMGVSRQALNNPIPIKIGNRNIPIPKTPFPSPSPFSYGPQPHTAFFCKLEFLSMEATHVWFKIHAGDYDVYSRKRW